VLTEINNFIIFLNSARWQ